MDHTVVEDNTVAYLSVNNEARDDKKQSGYRFRYQGPDP
ncbi:hypothetical protein IMCC3088_1595 [Aequoribacter fuscus]|uniref:Uncharacterized protein n=1 Tax=Aequoribacter fuscus TaxID=2518989 RepID=F3L228_9GAMM|nr:hypothetical protein IMCC3088_1595 [Aequoribacter fuscus]